MIFPWGRFDEVFDIVIGAPHFLDLNSFHLDFDFSYAEGSEATRRRKLRQEAIKYLSKD